MAKETSGQWKRREEVGGGGEDERSNYPCRENGELLGISDSEERRTKVEPWKSKKVVDNAKGTKGRNE